MRAIALFLALTFVLYTVVTDYQSRQISSGHHQAISQDVEASRVAIVSAERQFEVYEQATKNTTVLLDYINKTTTGMKEVSEILKVERIERQKPARVPRRPRTVRQPKGCYEIKERTESHGNTSVVIRDLVNTKCQ